MNKYLNDSIVISKSKPHKLGIKKYVQSIYDSYYYCITHPVTLKDICTETILVESSVVSDVKTGLRLYDDFESNNIKANLSIDSKIFMDMIFRTDRMHNIWASGTVFLDSGKRIEGWFIYKNAHNNFANTKINDNQYTTVLTNGMIDYKKIELVQTEGTESPPKKARSYSRAYNDILSNISNSIISDGRTTTTNDTNQSYISEEKKSPSPLKRNIDDWQKAIVTHAPEVVQNTQQFPPLLSTTVGYNRSFYEYDYTLDYQRDKALADLTAIYEANNTTIRSVKDNYRANISHYNRFKLANPDDTLSKGFMHVFFTKPDLNLFSSRGLHSQCKNDPTTARIYRAKPELFDGLTLDSGDDDFLWLLTNKVRGFSTYDTAISADKYGESFSGSSISFGRRFDNSGGDFQVEYLETRDLDIINFHEIWLDYINNVYRGSWVPKMKYIWGKILDYAISIYVIITAEDFETILYWCKFYGVFPINIPYSGLSWSFGEPITKVDINVTYHYSMREEYNPLALTELNCNRFKDGKINRNYVQSYDPKLGRAGDTWVGGPFVETIHYNKFSSYTTEDPTNGSKLAYKLRFSPRS